MEAENVISQPGKATENGEIPQGDGNSPISDRNSPENVENPTEEVMQRESGGGKGEADGNVGDSGTEGINSNVVACDVDDVDLCANRENPDEDDAENGAHEGGAHNRSHDSIESQRTIIEADDFASFLAQDDDDDDTDDFKDEDIDFDINDGEDGGVDLSALMKSGSNPYMLDFTAGMLADSEVEGDEDDDDDNTLSDNEGEEGNDENVTPRAGSELRGTPVNRDRSYRKTKSWLKRTAAYVGQGEERGEDERISVVDNEEDEEELDSPPRNFREEINNNVSKFAGIPPAFAPAHMMSVPPFLGGEGLGGEPQTVKGLPQLSKYLINNGMPSPAVPSKSQNVVTGQGQPMVQKPGLPQSQSLPHAFDPASQSSPKMPRSGQTRSAHSALDSSSTSVPTSPRHTASDSHQLHPHHHHHHHHQQQQHHNYDNRPSSPHNVPPHLHNYAFETPLRSPSHFSSSLENLAFFPPDAPPTSAHYLIDSYALEPGPMQRRNSMPNIAGHFTGGVADTCRNCGFSRQDYLFKIRLLQTQLEKTEKELKKKEKQWTADLGELKKENDRQQKIISQSLTLGPEAKIEATMQHEITRLTSENLDLRESIDKQTDQIRKLKKMLKVYAKKLKDGEAAEIAAELESEENTTSTDSIAHVIHRERTYMGMLEFKKEDEGALIKHLVLELKPKVAAGLIPGLPAYILFMCVRHTDYINDDDKVKSLLTSSINGIKKVVKRHSDDLERITLWLANTCRLLHTLKQYSGEKQFQGENTPKQNEQSLRNFDLSEYRQVFSDLAVWNYQALMKLMEELIQPNIVPAILEHEAIAGLTASKPSGLRGRASSNARDLEDGKDSQHSLDALMRTLNSYMRIVKQHAVDPELVKQIFRQLFYYLCAGALNNLLLRKDMCNWSKGMQIRYNLSHLEQWLRDNSLHEFGALAALDPIIQASQLLQARKNDADVDSICDMCTKLTTAQIVKILNIYTPVDEFEERVQISFIRKIQAKLKQRDTQGSGGNTLLMDTKYSYPVTFPFNPSSVALETIAVPEQLHLGFLIRH